MALARHGLWHTLRTVASAMVGIRRRRNHEEDAPELQPAQVVLAGIVIAVLFVLTLILVVGLVTR